MPTRQNKYTLLSCLVFAFLGLKSGFAEVGYDVLQKELERVENWEELSQEDYVQLVYQFYDTHYGPFKGIRAQMFRSTITPLKKPGKPFDQGEMILAHRSLVEFLKIPFELIDELSTLELPEDVRDPVWVNKIFPYFDHHLGPFSEFMQGWVMEELALVKEDGRFDDIQWQEQWPELYVFYMAAKLRRVKPLVKEVATSLHSEKKPDHLNHNEWLGRHLKGKRGKNKNVPLSFFGKVIDQDENGVPDISAHAVVEAYKKPDLFAPKKIRLESNPGMPDHLRVLKLNTTTDSSGLFSFDNISGYTIHVKSIKKEGYIGKVQENGKDEKRFFVFHPSRGEVHVPIQDLPIEFSLWKPFEPMPELYRIFNYRKRISADGQEHKIDLLRRIINPVDDVYDFSVKVEVPCDSNRGKYSWSFEITVPEGGIIETGDAIPFLAPVEGYVSTYKFSMPAEDKNWTGGFYDKVFYIKSRNGKNYSALNIDASSYKDRTSPSVSLSIDGFVNDTGSRNLQYHHGISHIKTMNRRIRNNEYQIEDRRRKR